MSLRCGVVGCGVIGQKHLEALTELPGVVVTTLADLQPAAAQAVAARFNVPRVAADARALVNDPQIDAVVLAIPTGGRADLAVAALNAGKHVLVEKPPGLNAAEVERILHARRDKVLASASSRFSLYPSVKVAADYVASGALGAIRSVRARIILPAGKAPEKAPPAWRLSKSLNGGGILANWGIYDLDYLMTLTGWHLQPETIFAQTWQLPQAMAHYAAPGSDAEVHYAAHIRCKGNIQMTIERAELACATADEAWEIIGDRGALHLRMTPDRPRRYTADVLTADGLTSQTICETEESYGNVHLFPARDFVRAIETRTRPATDGPRMLLLQRVMDGLYASAASGVAVTVQAVESLS